MSPTIEDKILAEKLPVKHKAMTTLTAAILFSKPVDQDCHAAEDELVGRKLVMLKGVLSIRIDEHDVMHILDSNHKLYSFPASIVERINTITEISQNQ